MLTLYGDALWESPFVYTVFVALNEKGIEHEMKLLSLEKGEHRQSSYAERSLITKVPAIEHDGFWLTESLAILEYLEERFPAPRHPSLFPSAIEERARARQLLSWLRTDIQALRAERSTSTIFFERARAPLGEKARADADRLIGLTERLLAPGASTLFPSFTVCDSELAMALHRLLVNGDPVPPAVRAYAEGIWARPSVRSYVERERVPPGRS